MRGRNAGTGLAAAVLGSAVIAGVAGASASTHPRPVARAGHVSGVAREEARPVARRTDRAFTTCSKPGGGNYVADCNSTGYPVNETWIASNGTTYAAGANDYNSYNGNADLGYYTSGDAVHWTDNGPLDIFPEGTNHAAGDPGLAIDAGGVVYYSSIYFDYFDCNVGGNELARYDPDRATWSYYQIANNSDTQFQDKPAVAVDAQHVFESWTRYGSCTGIGVPSPIRVAVFPAGPTSVPPLAILKVPGSTYSQGSSIQTDGHGGFWIAWEEFPSPSATVGAIWLDHWRGRQRGWARPQRISPDGFQDLPSPLPGFAFRDNSFPALGMVLGQPNVVWCSYDTGKGRTYWWANGAVATVSDSGGDQFFPSIASDDFGDVFISWSQTDQANQSYDQHFFSSTGGANKISTASSFPNQDQFFAGTFIGDYNGMTSRTDVATPIWTDMRRPDPILGGKAQDAMVWSG